MRYEWVEHRIGMVGPSSDTHGRGYIVYRDSEVEKDPDYIEGERGLNEDELGQKWKAIKQANVVPDLDSVMPDEIEQRGVGGGWDDSGERGRRPRTAAGAPVTKTKRGRARAARRSPRRRRHGLLNPRPGAAPPFTGTRLAPMDFLELARQRRSVRAYRPEPVPPALLERLLEAARLAPTACNRQPFRCSCWKPRDTRPSSRASITVPGSSTLRS
jgi:hypothetical protein